jgi:hypothetical protein
VCVCVRARVQLRQDFYNWVSIVTAASNINNILLDGAPLRSPILQNINNYMVATVYVEPGFHAVTAGPLSTAPFGAYAYGHSRFYDSSSAYGYPIVYKSMLYGCVLATTCVAFRLESSFE